MLFYNLHLRLLSGLSLSVSVPKPVRFICTAHLILLDLITRVIIGEDYTARSTDLCNFLHSPVTSAHLGPNNFLVIIISNVLSLLTQFRANITTGKSYSSECFNLYIFG
jgi:hypothetical protein